MSGSTISTFTRANAIQPIDRDSNYIDTNDRTKSICGAAGRHAGGLEAVQNQQFIECNSSHYQTKEFNS